MSIPGPPGPKGDAGAAGGSSATVPPGMPARSEERPSILFVPPAPSTTSLAGVFTGNVYGLHLDSPSSTTVTVGNGVCRDSLDAFNIVIAAATITVTTNGAINGNDSFQGPGTVSQSTTTVTGSSTTFLTSFGTRALTGTHSSSGATMTGTSSRYLSEIAIGDLIGNSSKGYFQVVSIASDTSLTLVSTPGSAFSAATCNAVENPTIAAGSGSTAQVQAIASDTSLTSSVSQTVAGSSTYRIGVVPNNATAPVAGQSFMFVWAAAGPGVTGCYVSTQRTTPFGVTGYTTYIRRIGSILTVSAAVQPFNQSGLGVDRKYQYEFEQIASNSRVLSGGTSTAWADVSCSAVVPPTADVIFFNAVLTGANNWLIYVRKRGAGSSTTSRNSCVAGNAQNSTVFAPLPPISCDGAQYVQYAMQGVGNDGYLDVAAYQESL